MKSKYSNLTSEIFSELCEGRFEPARVTQEMLDVACQVKKSEARRLIRKDGNLSVCLADAFLDPTINFIEENVPRCRDRHIVAILTVALTWGDDGWDDDRRVCSH